MRGRSANQKRSTLAALREGRGLTLKEAARAAHISYAYLAKLERGEKPLTNDMLRILRATYAEPEQIPMFGGSKCPK